MSVVIVQERLAQYRCQSAQAEEQALREISQEIALASLSRSGFFKHAAFQGGTCLRVFYHLNRFSEDLDFILHEAALAFDLTPYFKNLAKDFSAYGYKLEVVDRSSANNPVKKIFIKDDSVGKLLELSHLKAVRSEKKIRIKLEVDTNPPAGSFFENKFLDFPYVFSVNVQDLPSLFAGKIHALLCREYMKGRDWYDFIWYTSRRTQINYDFLAAALRQAGPFKGQSALKVDREWCVENLKKKIFSLDWAETKADVERFVKPEELPSLELWGPELFLGQLEKIG